MTTKEAEKLLEGFVAKLSEHFDAVQILASFPKNGGTAFTKRGAGNWFARQGMAHEFIQENQAFNNAAELKSFLPPPDETGDEWKKPPL